MSRSGNDSCKRPDGLETHEHDLRIKPLFKALPANSFYIRINSSLTIRDIQWLADKGNAVAQYNFAEQITCSLLL
jgi:hypothetical protein